MLKTQDIIDFCNTHNYDIRITKNGRWIDQKCTPDVVSVIADCINVYEATSPGSMFTTENVWHSAYTENTIKSTFKKPDLSDEKAKHEYDKFLQQSMELLSYAGALSKSKIKRYNYYQVERKSVLEYIADGDKNTLFFLQTYIEKVLIDSDMMDPFDAFFATPTKEMFAKMEESFSNNTIAYTKINGEVECQRIFTKVLNPLAFAQSKPGTKKGRLSKDVITYDMLLYNRKNFRDESAKKPKGVTRQIHAKNNPPKHDYKSMTTKIKRKLRNFNKKHRSEQTEHLEPGHLTDAATALHHIFPTSDFNDISYYGENIIALTPTQHSNYAHPMGKTHDIDPAYQHALLLSKVDRIQENLEDSTTNDIYSFGNLLEVLRVGFDDEDMLNIPSMDFDAVKKAIDAQYAP